MSQHIVSLVFFVAVYATFCPHRHLKQAAVFVVTEEVDTGPRWRPQPGHGSAREAVRAKHYNRPVFTVTCNTCCLLLRDFCPWPCCKLN